MPLAHCKSLTIRENLLGCLLTLMLLRNYVVSIDLCDIWIVAFYYIFKDNFAMLLSLVQQ